MAKQELSEEERERAFVAGVFDGEGSVSTYLKEGRCYPRLRIAMKDGDTVWRIYRTARFGSICVLRSGIWQWTADGKGALCFLSIWIGGLLSTRRQEQLDRALAQVESQTTPIRQEVAVGR